MWKRNVIINVKTNKLIISYILNTCMATKKSTKKRTSAKKSASSSKQKKAVSTKTDPDDEDNSGLFIPAGLFLGMGVGFYIGELVAGLFFGLGLGFVAFAIVKNRNQK